MAWLVWAGALAAAIVLGYSGQRGVGRLYRLFDNYNAQWFARTAGGRTDPLQSKTALGQIGRLKGSSRIVIRLEPKDGSRAPALLREASYRTWKGQVWYSELTRDKFENVYEGTNHTTWVLLPGEHQQRGGQPRLLSARPVRAAAVAHGQRAAGEPVRLRWLSKKHAWAPCWRRDPGLVVFDALYGPGPTIDSPANTNEDLAVPPEGSPRAGPGDRRVAIEAAEPANRRCGPSAAFFQDNDKFHYSTWQGLGEVQEHE